MKLNKVDMKKDDPELIPWTDATTHTRISRRDLLKWKDTRDGMGKVETIGYKLAADRYGTVFCTEYTPDGKDSDNDQFDITVLPKGKWNK